MNWNGKLPIWHGKVFSNGWVVPRGGVADVVDPSSGDVLGVTGIANSEDIATAASAAKEAQKKWAAMPFNDRAAILRKAAEKLREREAEFADWNVRECGAVRMKGVWEAGITYEQMHQAASLAFLPNGTLFPSQVPGRMNFVHRVPVGVVGVIAPWNFPLFLAMRSVAPALVLGNAVILKPDVQTAVTGGALIAEIFAEAGIPEGVLHVLPGGADAGDAMVTNPEIDMISFTGSTAVGRQIGEKCGRMLKKVTLELGGNNVHIVLPDADLTGAASCAAWGTFLHQGQVCMAAGRHLVHRDVAQQYAQELAARAKNLVVGDPKTDQVHLGPLINDKQVARVHALVESAQKQGAKVLVGGTHQGRFYQPTVLMDVRPDMDVFKSEIFGPVAPITVFDTIDEAIELANSSEYGLAASIHTSAIATALQIAKRLKTGMVHINDQPINCEPHVPFGGMGASGTSGRFGGLSSIDEFTQSQWISMVEKPTNYPF
ncbi:benzaldehyde dehydrogenase [Tepidiphilus succinatimandens]|uniref:benzaldehyde dehydrogenase n=1 Tax=Tepidiphilus succinatimandens TaxID=224436 RepID=UPI00112F4D36|nr:benzaldehyde dehydrogenase [Tepidiphilus succinatimandens]MDD2225747.1 benzaldehyde dehydrogenase [Dysgonamonadaceae bacterium]